MHQLAAQLATLQLYETSFKNSYVCFPVPANITGSFCAHTDKVNCAKISISGQYFVTGGDDAKASLWRANTLDLALAVPGTSPVTSVAIDDEEQIIAVGGESGAVKFVRLGTQKMHRFNGHRAKVTCLEFHSTGDHLVSGSIDGTVKVWQLSSASTKKDCVQTVKHNETPVTALLCAPDGRLIASGTNDGKIKITDVTVNKEKCIFSGHTAAVTCIKAHPEDLLLISASYDKTVRVWDLDRFEPMYVTELSSTPLRSVAFNGGEDFVALGNEYIKTYSGTGGKGKLSNLDGEDVRWGHIADSFLDENSQLRVVTLSSGGTVNVWNVDLARMHPWSEKQPTNNYEEIHDLNASATESALKELRKTFNKSHNIVERKPKTPALFHRDDIHDENEPKSPVEPKLPTSRTNTNYIMTNRTTIANLNPKDFLVRKADINDTSEEAIIRELVGTGTVYKVLSERLKNFRIVKRLMLNENQAREAIISVVKTKDHAIAVDIMKQMMKPEHVRRFMTLDICLFLLPLLQELFQSEHQDYVITALKMTAILYECFHKIIRDTIQAGVGIAGVDLNQEDRFEKCHKCKALFEQLQRKADIWFKHQLNEMGSYGRQLLRLMREYKL